MMDNNYLQTDPYHGKEHITPMELFNFQKDIMPSEEKMKFLEHISCCDYCSSLLAERMEEDLITAPAFLKNDILTATNRLSVQLTKKAKETSKKMQLFLYSLKVSTAAIGALALLLLTTRAARLPISIDEEDVRPKAIAVEQFDGISLTTAIRNNMDKLNNQLTQFSNEIINREVIDNDQKEK